MSSCSQTTLNPPILIVQATIHYCFGGEFHNFVTSSEHKSVDIIPICMKYESLFPPEQFLQTFRTKLNQLELILSHFPCGKVHIFHKICRNNLFPERVIARRPPTPPPWKNSIIGVVLFTFGPQFQSCIRFENETRQPLKKVCTHSEQ